MTSPAAVPTTQPPVTPAAVLALSPGYSDAAAAGAINWALSQVESYCERHFALRANTVTVTAYDGRALLPDPPVVEVTDVQALISWPLGTPLSWQVLDPATYQFTEAGEIYDARCYRYGTPWPSAPRGLKVTYSHGFEFWPQPVIDAVTALAVAYIANPAGMSELRVLDVTQRWMAGVGAAGIVDPFAGLSELVLREAA